jgi:hypothetical protein
MTLSFRIVFVGAAILALSWVTPVRAVLVWTEDFSQTGMMKQFTTADFDGALPLFNISEDESQSYWGINDPVGSMDDYDGDPVPGAGLIPSYTFPTGSGNYFVGEKLNADAANTMPLRLDWSNIPITAGLTSLTFSGLFAATANGNFENIDDIDDVDYVRVQYRLNSDDSAFTDLLWFSGDGDPMSSDDELALDMDRDGRGEGLRLSLDGQPFSAAIALTGMDSTLDLRILMVTTATGEEIAFDSFTIHGIESIPEPSAILYGGLVCGVIELGYVSRKLFGSKSPVPV